MRLGLGGRELDAWAFAPGEAPYRVKGINYRGHLTWTEDHYPGGVEAMHARLPPEISEFFGQPFLSSAFYDLHPLCVAGREMAPALDLDYLGFVRQRCEWQAESDVKSVYRMLLRFLSAERIAKMVPQQIKLSFDFADVETEVIDKGHVRGNVSAIPDAILPWWSVVVDAYIARVLSLAGLPTSHVTVRRLGGGADRDGVRVSPAQLDIFFHSA